MPIDGPEDSRAFRFLDLPPELRLCMYDFCIENSDHRELPTETRASPAPQFLALTQTCRSIRKEFRPTYLRKNHKWLLVEENIAGYIDAFYPGRSAVNIIRIPLTIMLPRPTLQASPSVYVQPALLPAFEALENSTDWEFRSIEDPTIPLPDLNALARCHRWSTLPHELFLINLRLLRVFHDSTATVNIHVLLEPGENLWESMWFPMTMLDGYRLTTDGNGTFMQIVRRAAPNTMFFIPWITNRFLYYRQV